MRCGDLSRVKIATDYFDGSINRIYAWVIGMRNVQKALLFALLQPQERMKQLQDEGRNTELMAIQETLKTFPFGDVWEQFCMNNKVPAAETRFATIDKYERDVLSKRV